MTYNKKNSGEKELLIRRVRADDCEDIWRWRNDPLVRQVSFSQVEIPLSDHRVWFDQRIKDVNTVMYLFENHEGSKVGQVRFQLMPDSTASISVNMNPPYMGRGLGTYVIAEATRTFFKEKTMTVSVQAEVLKDNIASRKAFEKAGYAPQGQFNKQGKEILVFVIKNEM